MAKDLQRQVLLVKNEAPYGANAYPVAASDAMPIIEALKPEIDPKILERGKPLHTLGRVKPLLGARAWKYSFAVEFFGSGTAVTPTRLGRLIKACGFAESVEATYVKYTPASHYFGSVTMLQFLAGIKYPALGGVGNMKISGKSDESVKFNFDMMALFQDPSDEAVPTPTFETNWKIPPQMLNVTFTLDLVSTFVLREFNLDMGTKIIPRPSANESSGNGYAGFQQGSRNPKGNIIVEAPALATHNFLTKWKAATEVACVITVGATAGNILYISIPKLTYENVQIEDLDGIMGFNIPINLNIDSGEDEIEIRTQ